MTEKKKIGSLITDFLFMNLGTLLMSIGVYFFKMTNGFATGGVSGIAITVSMLIDNKISSATLMMILNVILLIMGFIFLGREVGTKTVYCSLVFSAETWIFEKLIPLNSPLTEDTFLELVYAIMLTAAGSAILFACKASSGGTDITAMILKKYTSMDIGKALLAVDFVIASSSFFTYGVRIGLYSLLGLFIKAFLVDTIIESVNICKSFIIVTDNPEPIKEYILTELHHGVTISDAIGGYTGDAKKILITSCKRIEAVRLEKSIKEIDSHSFVIVTNSNKIIGRGFRGV